MSQIVAIHKIPDLKMTLFIEVDVDPTQKDCYPPDRIFPNLLDGWTGATISAADFLQVISNVAAEVPTQACKDLDKLELLSIEAISPLLPRDDTYNSIKFLTYASQQDVIEIFL